MMKKNIVLTFLFATCFSMTACSLMTREDLQKQDEQQRQLKDIQRSRADSDSRYNDIQTDQRNLSGRLDALEHNHEQSVQTNHQDYENLKKMIEAQNEKIKMIQEHIDATETRLTAAIQAATGASVGAGVPAPSTPAVGGGVVVAEKAPTGPLAEPETYFMAKEYKKAIVGYQAYVDKNPKGKLLPEANYKIGVCFGELGFKKDAKEFYKDVIDKYPSSSWAKKAKYRLSHLN